MQQKPTHVISDIDGCIMHPQQNITEILALREYIHKKNLNFSLCTGRPQPFVDAVVMLCNLENQQMMHVCENGVVFYDPSQGLMHQEIHPDLGDADQFAKIRSGYIDRLKTLKEVEKIELKLVPISVQPPEEVSINDCYEAVVAELSDEDVTFINHGHCIEVIPKGITKDKGIALIASRLNVSLTDILYIRDSINDIEAMNVVRYVGCPSNADDHIKRLVKERDGYISKKPYAGGTVEILQYYFA